MIDPETATDTTNSYQVVDSRHSTIVLLKDLDSPFLNLP